MPISGDGLLLHQQSQERMKAVEISITALSTVLIRIEENTKCLPDIDRRVDSLERSRDKANGGMAVLGFLWAGVEVLIHYLWKH